MRRRTWTDTHTFPAWRRRLALLAAVAVAGTALAAANTVAAGAATTRYEAEQAALSGGAAVATEHAGYSGSGFVGGYTDGNKGTATTTFAVTAAASGTHTLALRYANGTGSAKTLTLLVDGAASRSRSSRRRPGARGPRRAPRSRCPRAATRSPTGSAAPTPAT